MEQHTANINRINFRLSISQIADAIKTRFPNCQELLSLLKKCEDTVRYAADTPPGAEQLDAEVEKILNSITDTINITDENSLKEKFTLLMIALRNRETVIKTLR